MKTQTLESQILSFLQAVHIPDEPKTDSGYLEAQQVFAAGIDFLAKLFPNPAVNRLMKAAWEVISQKVVPVCFGLRVQTLSFIMENASAQPFIATPPNWARKIQLDPITQVGALVFVGSQAVDYTNDFLQCASDREKVILRAKAYEAEYLTTVRGLTPSWEPNSYQESLFKEFPEGVATPKARNVIYSIRPLVLA